jgi:hypothetical protein
METPPDRCTTCRTWTCWGARTTCQTRRRRWGRRSQWWAAARLSSSRSSAWWATRASRRWAWCCPVWSTGRATRSWGSAGCFQGPCCGACAGTRRAGGSTGTMSCRATGPSRPRSTGRASPAVYTTVRVPRIATPVAARRSALAGIEDECGAEGGGTGRFTCRCSLALRCLPAQTMSRHRKTCA